MISLLGEKLIVFKYLEVEGTVHRAFEFRSRMQISNSTWLVTVERDTISFVKLKKRTELFRVPEISFQLNKININS